MIGRIKLTGSETGLLERISFVPHPVSAGDLDALRTSIEPAYQLTQSLLARDAIPQARWRYFIDPALNIGVSRSRKATIEHNGRSGVSVYRNPAVLKHLRYLVLGPDLPATTMQLFGDLVKRCGVVTSGDQKDLCSFARSEVRRHGLEHRSAAAGFHLLCLELGLSDWMARAVRDAVMSVRAR